MRPSEALARHRDEALAIIAKYPVANPRLFGSTARGEDRLGSDLDILVDRVGPMSFFDIFDLEGELEQLLGCPVEVFTALKPQAIARAGAQLRAI